MRVAEQLKAQWAGRESKILAAQKSFEERKKEDDEKIKRSNESANEALRTAYGSLHEAVNSILKLPDGRARISSSDTSILQSLQKAIDDFQRGEKFLRSETDLLSDATAQNMNDGDHVKAALTVMEKWLKTLNIERDGLLPEITSFGDRADNRKREAMRMIPELLNRVGGSAALENNDGIDETWDMFITTYREQNFQGSAQFKEIEIEVNTMNNRQTRRRYLHRELDKIISTMSGSRATITKIADNYYVEQKRTQAVWEAIARVWSALLGVKRNVESPSFKTTRDNSLRQVLLLLQADDQVLQVSWPAAGKMQQDIYATINKALGDGAVLKLTAPTSIAMDEFAIGF